MILPKDTTSHTMSIAGSKLHYVVCHQNKKPTILMLHGFSGNHRGLIPFIQELPDYRIIAIDFPGFGDSTGMKEHSHTIVGYTECVAELLKKLALPEPPIVLGHSFGTLVAARLAAKHPQLTSDKLILISPASVSPYKTLSGRTLAAWLGEMHYFLGNALGTAGDKLLHSKAISRFSSFALITTKDKKIRQAIYAHHLVDLRFLKRKDVFRQAYRSLNRDDILHYAPDIHKNTLLIAGRKDAMWPPKTQTAVHKKIKRSKLMLLPGVGHLTHFEAPKQIGKLIRSFLNSK